MGKDILTENIYDMIVHTYSKQNYVDISTDKYIGYCMKDVLKGTILLHLSDKLDKIAKKYGIFFIYVTTLKYLKNNINVVNLVVDEIKDIK